MQSMIVFHIVGGILLLLLAASAGWAGARFLLRRSAAYYPDQVGTYPAIDGHAGRTRYFHDPNRAPTVDTSVDLQEMR